MTKPNEEWEKEFDEKFDSGYLLEHDRAAALKAFIRSLLSRAPKLEPLDRFQIKVCLSNLGQERSVMRTLMNAPEILKIVTDAIIARFGQPRTLSVEEIEGIVEMYIPNKTLILTEPRILDGLRKSLATAIARAMRVEK